MHGTDLDHNKLIITSSVSQEIQEQGEAMKGGIGVVILRNNNDEFEYNCQSTPTRDANKIPTILAPPPAPRKPAVKRKRISSCKRKLFGQILVKGEEIDTFFKSSFEELAVDENSAMIVKRCK